MRKEIITIKELLDYKMESKPLVSIIIPVYNVEKYLRRCLESVIAQTYDNVEIILVNDGSTDNSGKICDEYLSQDKRIVVFHQKNKGLSGARNTGIVNAKGEYISFIDSDDYFLPDAIEVMLRLAMETKVDIVQSKLFITDGKRTAKNKEVLSYELVNGKDTLNRYDYKVSACGKLYKTELVRDNLFPDVRIHEDDASYYRFAYYSCQICMADFYSYYYFLSDDSLTRNGSKDKKTDYIQIYYDRISFFEKRNEELLVLGSRERFCLVLMLNYAAYWRNRTNANDRPKMLKIFREQFPYLKKYESIGLLRRCAYWMFYYFPNMISLIIGLIRK